VFVSETVPTLPEADTPVIATVREGVTTPTLPVARLPVSVRLFSAATAPTDPVAALPVKATVTSVLLSLGSDENGVSENAEIPNMAYGLSPSPH
jgi:hypothetical protein